MTEELLLTKNERAKTLRDLHRRMKQYGGCSHAMEFEAVEEALLAKAKPIIEGQERERMETLFADTPSFTTFIRTRDNKAGVEECYLIMKSEWQAPKEGTK